ncbi:GNAT family N-acetyltransferase [Enterococcus lemanii]|uniref:GNAT family N-acetyltransferase n=1 Tax=Enterococcus lemanii TaxID=1159752 RepID=A0ABV9MXJ8_9ENTE|nr:GNAT family N-acetyltransferase [Enterococcus lemanii]MBM7709633.1 GNAT superfamily N-acetyltransferase [Enterococcus lemanii]
MKLRQATKEDLPIIMTIIQEGIDALKEQQSPQWQDGFGPNQEKMEKDIETNACYVLVDGQDEVIATASLIQGIDPVYTAIEDGHWLGLNSYIAIHRVAIAKGQRGKKRASLLLDLLISQAKELGYHDIRIDTHRLNLPMQKAILSSGFSYRGLVHFPIPNGERLAYQIIL